MADMVRLLAMLALILSVSLPATAQDQATLVSDSLEITGDTRLIADGNVEIFFKGRRLKASRIVFDQATNRLEITGPIVLTEESGDTLILASQADLAADMSEGILTSARLVLNQQLQMAANRIVRVAGRYTALQTVAASSCKVCEGDPTPLWEIRARRVVHDEVERQIYFDRAQFRLAGVPVLYIPRLRMPDPTLKRATGFLMPSIRTTSDLGTGIKLPYFIVLGPSADLTLTPYLTTKNSETLGLRYRQAFATGLIELNGSMSRDDLIAGKTRGYLRLQGAFTLPERFKLTFDGQTVTDPAVQPVGVAKPVVQHIGRIGDGLAVEGQKETLGQGELALYPQVAAGFTGEQLVTGHRAGRFDQSGREGLPVAQAKGLGLPGGEVRRQRQVGGFPQHDEVRQLDPGPEIRGRADRRHQEARCAFQRRIGHAEARDIQDRHTGKPELRAVKVDLPFHLVMHDPAGANFP
jgi:hypothetical protein